MLGVNNLCLSAGGRRRVTAIIWGQDPIIQLASIQVTLWVATLSEVGVEPFAFNNDVTALAACWHTPGEGKGEVICRLW